MIYLISLLGWIFRWFSDFGWYKHCCEDWFSVGIILRVCEFIRWIKSRTGILGQRVKASYKFDRWYLTVLLRLHVRLVSDQ